MLLLANAVIEEGFSVDGGLPSICRYTCAYLCSLLQLDLIGVLSGSFCGAKRWNATLRQCSLPAILGGNAGYAATASTYCAYVFDRSVDIGEDLWVYWWSCEAFGWRF